MGEALATLVWRPGRQFCSLAADIDRFDFTHAYSAEVSRVQ